MDVSEEDLQALYTWVDEIPLSRPKRNIARDFSDGVLLAEVIAHYFPKLVQLHNYSSANGMQQKLYNWTTLNTKVLRRLGISLSRPDIEAIASVHPGAIERLLKTVKAGISATGISGEASDAGACSPASAAATPEQAPMGPVAAAVAQAVRGAGPGALAGSGSPGLVGAGRTSGKLAGGAMQASVGPQVLAERDLVISELRETNQILESKVGKLEQLLKLKDAKIAALTAKLAAPAQGGAAR